MLIFKVIDCLFIFTRYLCFSMGVAGILGSIILALCNISLGIYSVLLFLAAFLLSIAVTLLLMPEKIISKLPSALVEKRWVLSIVLLIVSTVLTGVIYFLCGGFPEMNLIFI